MKDFLITTPVCVLLFSALLAGCQAPPDVRALEQEKASLAQELSQARDEIALLRSNARQLESDVAELQRVTRVLDEEKAQRVNESLGLRGEVRRFVQARIDSLKQFLLHSDLLDYVGGELVERPFVDAQPLLVVDLENRVPRNGTLTGAGGYFAKPGVFRIKVLRPVGDELIAVWESAPLRAEGTGHQQLVFPLAVGVEAGDVIAWHFPEGGLAGYHTGTGDSRFRDDDIRPGETLRPGALEGRSENRAYALGVYGLLNADES